MDDIIKAAEMNGFEWTKKKYYNGRGPITEACVLGQIALNTKINPNDLLSALNMAIGYGDSAKIWHYNDFEATSYEDSVANLKKVLSSHQGKEITVKTLTTKREIIRKG